MKALLRTTLEATRGVVKPLLARRRGVGSTPATTRTPRTQASFPAVTIRPCPNACEAALALGHRRILKRDAPEELPLQGCTKTDCRCRLEEFDDRRAEGERRDRPDDACRFDDGENRRLPGDRRINKQRSRPTAYFNDHQ